jgi:hypothetical protein
VSTVETTGDQREASKATPYLSWSSFTNLLDKIRDGGAPSQIDRTWLGGSGSYQSAALAALRAFGFVDADDRPTERLLTLAKAGEAQRPELMRPILTDFYGGAFALGSNATQGHLEKWIRDRGLSGETVTKAISFFLAAAKFADVPVSPFWKAGKVSSSQRPGKRRAPTPPASPIAAPPPGPKPDDPGLFDAALRGLLRKLPPEGATWPRSRRDAFVKAFENVLDLCYDVTDDLPAAARIVPRERAKPDQPSQA